MLERQHYSNAPITEAVIDLRITTSQDVSVEQLAEIRNTISNGYSHSQNIFSFSGQMGFQFGESTTAQAGASQKQIGLRFISQNKQQVLQIRLDGFSFSTLAPYDKWETFRDEASRLWKLYWSAAKVEGVTRAALRYINRLDIPNVNTIELKDYLKTFPEVSAEWSNQDLSGFFMQLQLPQADLGCTLLLNQSPAPPPNAETLSILLDIDLFKEQPEQPWIATQDTEVWEFLERLHDRKNEIFEGSITEKMRELIR